jgi:GNAT superfamily N-acetyltransferase
VAWSGDDINRMLQNQRNAIQRESQSRQMLTNLGAPPVKKFSDGGPAGSSSGVRRLKMSGYQEGGEVTDDMFVGTRPEDFPETSPVDKKAGELLRALSEGTRGFVGAEPIEPGSEAYRTGQALANMPAVGVVAATAKGAGKAKDALKSMLPSAKLVDTPEFQNWFGRSKTVNEGGKPLVLYHATPKDITEFIPGGQNPELSGPAIWMTPNKDFQPAAHNLYTGKGSFVSGANVIPLFASVKNPLITSLRTWKDDLKPFGGSPWTLDKEAVSKMKKAGHDGIMYYDEKGNLEEVAVFKPTQVKSAISNEGTFSPRKKAITKAQGGEVSNDEFIQEMMVGTRPTDLPVKRQEEAVSNDNSTQEMFTGTRPSDFPETSPVDTAVSDFISSRSKLVTDPQEFFRVMGQNLEEYHGKPLREDPEKYLMEQLGPGALAGIIKMPGGNYLAGQVEKALAETKTKIPWTNQQISEMPQVAKAHEKDLALNKFIETKLTKYVKNDMATERDPLRLQADKWATEQQPKLLAEKDAQIVKAKADMEKAQRERGVEPEMLTRSRARILELEKEREFIAERTGLHYVPRQIPELYRGGVNFARQNQGFPSTAVARSEAGKLWEDFSDRFLANRSTVEEVTAPNYFLRDTDAQRIMAENPWLSQVPPETQVRFLNSGLNQQDTGFKHMADELRNALNPSSGLPPSLQISTKDLEKMTVPQAADLVDRINAHRAVQKAEANKLAAQKSIEVYKEYPETEQGLRWVEMKIPSMPEDFKLPEGYKVVKDDRSQMQKTPWFVRGPDGDIISGDRGLFHATPEEALKNATEKTYREIAYPELESALKYEGDIMKHCVGGYCPDVISGESRIFSLRDSSGMPHATVEVAPDPINTWDDVSNVVGPEEASRLWKEFSSEPRTKRRNYSTFLEFIEKKGLQAPEKIKQIKGVLNKKPEDEYIPFVQDFVKSQRWSSVGDMANTGLIDLRDNRALNVLGIQQDVGELRRIREAIKSDYITLEELRKFRSPGGYAAGGEVTNDEFIQQMMTGTPMSDTSTRPGILPPELREAIDVPLDFANLLIRGTAAVPIGGFAGLYKGLTGGKYGTQEGVKEADTEAARMMAEITGEPKTQTAKDVLQFVGDKMQEYKLDAAMPQLLTLPSPGAGTTEFIKQAVRSEFEAPPVGAVTLKPDASTDLGIKKLQGGLIFPEDETAERLRLKVQRRQAFEEKGKAMPGAPKNARTVIKAPKDSGLPDFVVGDIRPQDWVARTENLLKPDEIQQYGRWYDDVRGTFLKYTDGDEKLTDKYMRAWLVANQNIGVEGAFNNVLLQAEQFARKVPQDQMRAGGLPFATQAARNALQDQPITEGVGLKIADFVDSAEGKSSRSIYGNAQEAGAPFVVDIHTARDTGLVDDILLNHLERSGYKVDRNKIKTDLATGPTDTQYENRADFGRDLTSYLNQNNWQGRSDWTPKEIQAIGWMAMTKLTRDAADDTVTALERSLRRLSMEFSPGKGSPWATQFGERFKTLDPEGQRELTQVATSRAVEMAKQVSGIDLRNIVHGSGGWQKFQNPATVAQALATKEGSEIAANALGYLLNQTEVWSNAVKSMTKNPKAFAIDFVQKKGDDLSTDQGIMGFWEKVMEADPTGLFVGYHPFTTVDNQPGIRVIVDKGGAKRMQDIQAALEGPIAKMIKDSPLDIDARGYENELVKAVNNWEENPDGQLYLARLADLGVGSPATRLNPLRGELETAIESWFENRAGAAKPGSGKGAAPTTPEAPAAEGVKRRRGKGTTSAAEDLAALGDIVKKAQDKNIDLQAAETDSVIDIGLIKVPKRGKGLGTEAMQELTEYADRTGKPIRLVPDPNIARNIDPERLVSFYERLGFVKQEPQVGQAESGSTFRQFAPTYWVYTPKIKKAKGGEVSITDFIKRAA